MQTAELSAEQIVFAAARLSPPELERLVGRLLILRAERGAPATLEDSLLARIRQPWPAWRARLNALKAKRRNETLAPDEDDELTRLADQAEEWHAERMTALAALAQLRGVSLSALMEQLGIVFPEYE
jgi:hypothetical protein